MGTGNSFNKVICGMQFRELTSMLLASLGLGCTRYLLDSLERTIFIRRRNQWVDSNLPLGLTGLIAADLGETASYTLEMPIELAPMPLIGKNICVIVCYWISPHMATANQKKLIWERVIERVAHRGFSGIALVCPAKIEMLVFQSMGFSIVCDTECMGTASSMVFLDFKNGTAPAMKKPATLALSKRESNVLDIFYPPFCPIGTLLFSRVRNQLIGNSLGIEPRAHDTGTRESVLEFGRTMGAYLNGKNITADILRGAQIEDIVMEQK